MVLNDSVNSFGILYNSDVIQDGLARIVQNVSREVHASTAAASIVPSNVNVTADTKELLVRFQYVKSDAMKQE